MATLLSVSFVVATALVGLVIEDFLPNEPGQSRVALDSSTSWRLVATAAAIVLLILTTWIASQKKLTSGTLYYVRMLDERAPDLHDEARQRHQRRSLDYRSFTRSLDLGVSSEVDVVEGVQCIRRDLETAVSTDDPLSGFEFASNLHWPIAFALGSDWPMAEDAKIVELAHGDSRPALETTARPVPPTPLAPAARRDYAARLVHVDIFVPGRRFEVDGDVSGIDVRSVVPWRLSGGDERLDVEAITAVDERLFGRRPDQCIRVREGETRLEGQETALLPLHHAGADLAAAEILKALDSFPAATVVISANVSRATAVLAGRYFAERLRMAPGSPEQSRQWISPWSRLCLLIRNRTNYLAGVPGEFQAMRVHPSQPIHPPLWRGAPGNDR